MTTIPASELILNPDGSVYHLHLRPEDIASTIITVGDPDRVPKVSKYFDHIDFKVNKREFVTHTGRLKGKRLSVISTGIGTDNIDIVFNELDALVNIDLKTRTLKSKLTSLDIIRIGTSGSLQADIPVDSFLISSHGMGLDSLLSFYKKDKNNPALDAVLEGAFKKYLEENKYVLPVSPYLYSGSEALIQQIGEGMFKGVTLTCPGFYAPQGRSLRLATHLDNMLDVLSKFQYEQHRLTNFEMETAGIYGLSALLGHRAISCNAILANRQTGQFSQDPKAITERLIKVVLERICA